MYSPANIIIHEDVLWPDPVHPQHVLRPRQTTRPPSTYVTLRTWIESSTKDDSHPQLPPIVPNETYIRGPFRGGQDGGGEGCVLCVMHYTSDWSSGRCPQELLTNRNHSLNHRNLTRPTSAPLFINRQPPPIPHQTAHHRSSCLSQNWFIMIFKKMRSLCPSPQNYNNMQMTNVLIECDCHARGNYAAHLHTSPTRAQPNISFARVPPTQPLPCLENEWCWWDAMPTIWFHIYQAFCWMVRNIRSGRERDHSLDAILLNTNSTATWELFSFHDMTTSQKRSKYPRER